MLIFRMNVPNIKLIGIKDKIIETEFWFDTVVNKSKFYSFQINYKLKPN